MENYKCNLFYVIKVKSKGNKKKEKALDLLLL